MATGRGGYSTRSNLGFLIYGEQGTWKSSMCLEFLKYRREDGSPFRVLYIDCENGSIDDYLDQYEEMGVDLQNLYILYTHSLSEVSEYINRAKNDENLYIFDDDGNETDEVYLDGDGKPFRPDAIVVDGVSLLYVARQQGIVEFSKKRATVRAKKNELAGMEKIVAVEGAGLEIKDYNTLKFDGQDLILNLLGCNKHFAVTCREEDEKEQYKDKDGSIKMMATGRKQPSGFKDIRYNVKTVIRMFKDDDGIIKGFIENKDRTNVHKQDELIEEPTLMDWEIVISKNRTKKQFNKSNLLNDAVKAELQSLEKDTLRFDDEFEQTKNEQTNNQLNSVEAYHNAISEKIKTLNVTQRAKKQAVIANNGWEKNFKKINDIEILKQYLAVISE